MKELKNHQFYSCEKKIDYKNWQEAEKACIKVMDEGIRQLVMAYKCKFEEHWHIGHNPRVTNSLIFDKARSEWIQKRTPPTAST